MGNRLVSGCGLFWREVILDLTRLVPVDLVRNGLILDPF